MAELTHAGEDHRDVVLVRGLDHFLIADRTTWLHDCRHSSLRRLLDAVAEREECIRSHHRTLGVVAGQSRLMNGEESGVHSRHLAGADSDRRSLPAKDNRVRLDASYRAPGKAEIPPFAFRWLSLGDDAPVSFASTVARGTLLREESTADALVIERMIAPSSVALEYAKILFAPEDLEGIATELGGNDTFDEETRHRFGRFAVYADIEGDHRTERRDRIAGQSLSVGLERIRARREATGCRVLDYRAARFIAKRVGCEECSLQIEQVIEGEFLASFLPESGDAVFL